jgi:hypothetical protein
MPGQPLDVWPVQHQRGERRIAHGGALLDDCLVVLLIAAPGWPLEKALNQKRNPKRFQ